MLELNLIYNEDCLIGMQNIDDLSIDCIICDLPYGTTRNQWDSVIDLDKLWTQYKRIIKKLGAIVLFALTPFDKVLGASNLEMLKYEWIWEKEMGTGFLNANYAPLKSHENILVFSYGSASHNGMSMTYNPLMVDGKPYSCHQGNMVHNYDTAHMVESIQTINNGKRFPKSVLNFNRDATKIHPTQKPVALVEYLIKTYSNEGNLILDNCMGSGTTAIAAMRTNRNFIGFELDKEYYNKSLERIEQEKLRIDKELKIKESALF